MRNHCYNYNLRCVKNCMLGRRKTKLETNRSKNKLEEHTEINLCKNVFYRRPGVRWRIAGRTDAARVPEAMPETASLWHALISLRCERSTGGSTWTSCLLMVLGVSWLVQLPLPRQSLRAQASGEHRVRSPNGSQSVSGRKHSPTSKRSCGGVRLPRLGRDPQQVQGDNIPALMLCNCEKQAEHCANTRNTRCAQDVHASSSTRSEKKVWHAWVQVTMPRDPVDEPTFQSQPSEFPFGRNESRRIVSQNSWRHG